jgi:hypothetical protein
MRIFYIYHLNFKNMEKKLIVEFNFGKRIELDAEAVANTIAEILENDSHADTVAELLNDEIKLFDAVWCLPWVELCPHIIKECEEDPKTVCLCNEWKKGNAKISVNW